MEKKKVRVGVLGAGRGQSLIDYCCKADNAELVAICDRQEEKLQEMREKYPGEPISYYTEWKEFLNHDMDVVVLANYNHQHAPFAIEAMERGLNVISELMPCQTMKEAVELVETIERTGKIYCFAENYCYMEAPWEMRRLYRDGIIGDVEHAQCEYVHDREDSCCYGCYTAEPPKMHWYATYYCTHAIGPIRHITGLRPVKVTGFEFPFSPRHYRCGMKNGNAAIEMIELENGAYVKSYHGESSTMSIWYSLDGAKGRMESERHLPEMSQARKMFLEYYPEPGHYDEVELACYYPQDELSKDAQGFGFDGADYRMMWHFMETILGNPKADHIDIYEALDMFLPGMFAYRSVLQGGIPVEVPDLRDPAQRDKWRNDTACVDPEVAGDMLWPSYSKGEIEIPNSVYEKKHQQWMKGMPGLRDKETRRWKVMAQIVREQWGDEQIKKGGIDENYGVASYLRYKNQDEKDKNNQKGAV